MVKLSAVKGHRRKFIIFIVIVLSASVVSVSTLITLSSSSPPPSVASKGVNSTRVLHSLSATLIRVQAPDPASPGSPARLVLSIEAADITDFIDAYRRGFVPEPVRYPDDGGILLHNPELCRGRSLDWVVYVHTSPGHRRRRQLLRDTWANLDLFKHLNFRVVFLLGKPPPESSALQV